MRSPFRSLALAGVLLLACGHTAAAQLPGGSVQDTRDGRQAYLAQVLGNVESVAQEWRAARETRDSTALARLYSRDAVLMPATGRPSRGDAEVRRALAERLPRQSEFRATFADFTASGGLAYYSGEFTFIETGEDGDPYTVSGTYVLVLQREGSRWRIRSQVEHPDVEVLLAQLAPAPAPAPATAVAPAAEPTPAAPPSAAGALP